MANINNTLASSPADPRIELLTPLVDTDFTLSSTGIKAGSQFLMLNNGVSPVITLKASNGDIVQQVFSKTGGTVVALQDNPTTAAHWTKADAAAADSQGSAPIGSIIAYNPGYYTNGSNAGFTTVGPGVNTAAGVNAYLPTTWRVCDGQTLNDPASPIFNGAGRFLPNLTDSRFLIGVASAGSIGGSSTTNISHDHGVTSNVSVATHTGHTHDVTSNVSVGNHADHTHQYNGQGGLVGSTIGPAGFMYTTGSASVLAFGDYYSTLGSSAILTHSVTNNAVTSTVPNATLTHSVTNNAVTSGAASVSSVSILPTYLSTFYIMRVK
jgi:hypothetical protein